MTEEPATIPTHQAPSRAQRLVKDGDVILSTVRPNRRSMLYARNPSPNTVVSTGFAVLRARESDIDSRFLYALVQDRAFTDYLVTREQGAAYPAISTNDIFEAEVALPPLWEQRRIAQVLGSLDDKIELHRRMCATLEEMARAIFRSWFVDFDPVRAKVAAIAEGRDPERAAMAAISGKNEQALDTLPAETLASLRATASLFPSSFTDSELGEIPEGWHDGRLAELCTLNESSWNNRTLPEEVHYIDLANTKSGEISEVQHFTRAEAPSRARRILRAGDTIVGTVRPGNRSYALIPPSDVPLTGSTGFAVLTPRRPELREVVYFLATDPENIDRLAQLADGAAYPAVRPDVMASQPATLPPQPLLERFYALVGPMTDRAALARAESRTLAALRDTLLPKLLSGELNVDCAAEQAQPAGMDAY